MEQLNSKSNDISLVKTRTEGNAIIVDFGQNISKQEFQVLSNQMKEITEILHLGLERNREEIQGVKKTIETNHITPQQLGSLESLVDKKARAYVDKTKGVQLTIDVLLNYDNEELNELQLLINKQYGRIKQRIWIDLNKECLERKGTDPKNRIPATQVDEAFDYVRTWGGFSI